MIGVTVGDNPGVGDGVTLIVGVTVGDNPGVGEADGGGGVIDGWGCSDGVTDGGGVGDGVGDNPGVGDGVGETGIISTHDNVSSSQ